LLPAASIFSDKAMLSSTNLQMILYYNFFFSLAYTWFYALTIRWKYLNSGDVRAQFVTPALFVIWALVEAGRLYVGYTGNMNEDTPGMAAFIFLTIFPQFILMLYFVGMQTPLFGFDKIWNGIMLFILALELIVAWRNMSIFIADKTARFAVEYGAMDEEGETEQGRTQVESVNRFALDDGVAAGSGSEPPLMPYDDIGAVDSASDRAMRPGGGGEVEMGTLSRGSTLAGGASFGGPRVTPYATHAKAAPRGAGAPRASAAPSAVGTTNYSGAFPSGSSGLVTKDRSLETPEERAARRARDRAIIEGRLVPARPREEEEAAALARAQLEAASALEAERQAELRPRLMASLTQSSSVRIPFRNELQTPGRPGAEGTAEERQSLAASKRE
jgi:hypothetical protein